MALKALLLGKPGSILVQHISATIKIPGATAFAHESFDSSKQSGRSGALCCFQNMLVPEAHVAARADEVIATDSEDIKERVNHITGT